MSLCRPAKVGSEIHTLDHRRRLRCVEWRMCTRKNALLCAPSRTLLHGEHTPIHIGGPLINTRTHVAMWVCVCVCVRVCYHLEICVFITFAVKSIGCVYARVCLLYMGKRSKWPIGNDAKKVYVMDPASRDHGVPRDCEGHRNNTHIHGKRGSTHTGTHDDDSI